MYPVDKKSVVEGFDIHDVWNVSYIWEVQSRFHIETKDLQRLCVCVNPPLINLNILISFSHPLRDQQTIEIILMFMKTPTKTSTKGSTLYRLFCKKRKLSLKGDQFLDNMIWSNLIHVVTNSYT